MDTTTTNNDLAPRIPRRAWSSHPRFPAQVLLLGSHENFRRLNAHLVEEASTVDRPGTLEGLYRRWISAMRSHEGYEEYKLYPYLERRWGVSFLAAEAGHHALHERHAAVLSAFALLRGTGDPEDARRTLVSALRDHDDVLRAHLALEEDLVIPLLLELPPAEFDTFCHSSIEALMRSFDQSQA